MTDPAPSTSEHEGWMLEALALADQAEAAGEVPVGAVLVDSAGKVLGRGQNSPVGSHDPTAHAEILALRAAALATGNYRLPGTTLYVTVEPCTMCAGALIHARVARVVFGAREPKGGAIVSRTLGDGSSPLSGLNHRLEIVEGVLAEACAERLQRFFAARRGVN
ncbi:MAG: tRNA adenosine(34) deaminase TadA [Pseudomonadota bacterium]